MGARTHRLSPVILKLRPRTHKQVKLRVNPARHTVVIHPVNILSPLSQ